MAEIERTSFADDPVLDLEIKRLEAPSWRLRPLDDVSISELMRSIENLGLLQPVVVRESQRGYQIVFGNHRIEACRRLGMKKIRAIVRHFTDEEAFLARVTENLLRNTYVNPIEEAEGYRMLITKGWTINGIARKVGKCDSYVCERLALLENLDSRLRARISQGSKHLTPSHAELLSRIVDKKRQSEIATLVETRRLSVRALENLVMGAPLPTKVPVEVDSGSFCFHVPDTFAKALRLKSGESLTMSVRGRKLVLEAPKAYRRNTWSPPRTPTCPLTP